VNEFSAQDPKTIEAELKDIYEWICVQHIVNKKNWIIIFVIVHALNHSSPTRYSPFRIFVLLIPTCLFVCLITICNCVWSVELVCLDPLEIEDTIYRVFYIYRIYWI
jgi:hypothetical protein